MLPVIAALAAGAGMFMDASNQDRANRENKNAADQNTAWQQYMSNSAYRRAMEDMKAAGLNPMLAYKQGGASTPSGNVSTSQAVTSGSAASALSSAKLATDVAAVESQVDVNASTKALNEASALERASSARKQAVETQNAKIEGKLMKDKLPKSSIDRDMAVPDAFLERADRIIDIINPLRPRSPRDPGDNPIKVKPPKSREGSYGKGGGIFLRGPQSVE